jgi:hypothetical protein
VRNGRGSLDLWKSRISKIRGRRRSGKTSGRVRTASGDTPTLRATTPSSSPSFYGELIRPRLVVVDIEPFQDEEEGKSRKEMGTTGRGRRG